MSQSFGGAGWPTFERYAMGRKQTKFGSIRIIGLALYSSKSAHIPLMSLNTF